MLCNYLINISKQLFHRQAECTLQWMLYNLIPQNGNDPKFLKICTNAFSSMDFIFSPHNPDKPTNSEKQAGNCFSFHLIIIDHGYIVIKNGEKSFRIMPDRVLISLVITEADPCKEAA